MGVWLYREDQKAFPTRWLRNTDLKEAGMSQLSAFGKLKVAAVARAKVLG